MLYYRETSTESATEEHRIILIEFCKRCGYERNPEQNTADTSAAAASAMATVGSPSDRSQEIIVYEKSYEQGHIQPQVDIVAFGDPAVPTTKEVVCPNAECPSRKEGVEASAKFIVLNPDTYSILYRCTHETCGKVWRNKN